MFHPFARRANLLRRSPHEISAPEVPLIVVVALLGPALLLGAAFGWLVWRHPAWDPASARPAHRAATRVEEHLEERRGLARRLGRRFDASTTTGLLLGLALLVFVISGLVLGVLALVVRTHPGFLSFDRSLENWGEQHATDFATWCMNRVTSLGSTGVLVVTTLAVFVVETIRRPSRWLPAFLVAVAIGQTLLSTGIKELVDRVRPTANPIAHTLGPSFPSGHTTGAAACFAAFALVLGRGRSRNVQSVLAGAAVFVALAVAASRVLLGVHWLSDVIGGLALGWAWFAACSIAFGGRLLRLGAPVEAAERVAVVAGHDSG
ncbi:MAG: phosphatase PAP2 family protein [Acidimicrobiia bacterium]